MDGDITPIVDETGRDRITWITVWTNTLYGNYNNHHHKGFVTFKGTPVAGTVWHWVREFVAKGHCSIHVSGFWSTLQLEHQYRGNTFSNRNEKDKQGREIPQWLVWRWGVGVVITSIDVDARFPVLDIVDPEPDC